MPFVDFEYLKQKITIAETARILDLKLTNSSGQQLRGPCPICRRAGDRALVITPSKNLYYCFAAEAGGDQIALVAHIRNCEVAAAAQYLLDQTGAGISQSAAASRPSAVPQPPAVGAPGFPALTYLQADHAAVAAVGFDIHTALRLGVGYAPKGILRGTVAIPVRLDDGRLAGYIGVTEARLPAKWHLPDTQPDDNVVTLPQKQA